MFEPNLVILTTKTDHHTYYINKIAKEFSVKAVFFENNHVQAKFPIGPLFENEQFAFEKEHFFKDVADRIGRNIVAVDVPTVNTPGISDKIKYYNADLGIVFGCGKIKPHMLTVAKDGLINIHRGIANKYRGLDSDLWAIYHGDYKNIGVTIHQVNEELDTGNILRVQKLKIEKDMKIHQLCYYETVMAAEMTLDILREYRNSGELYGITQEKIGRYYSFMPLVLKKLIQVKFNKYAKKLL